LNQEFSVALQVGHQTLKKIIDNREQAAAEVNEMKTIALKILDSHNSNQKP